MQYFDDKNDQIQYHLMNSAIESEESQEFFTEKPSRSFQSETQTLKIAQQNFNCYMKMIGKIVQLPVRDDVLRHCEQYNEKQINVLAQLTLQQVESKIKLRIQKMIKNKRIKKNWSEQDVIILIWVISKYAHYEGLHNVEKEMTDDDWKRIARMIPGSTSQTCKFKYLNLKKVNLSVKQWTSHESSFLSILVNDPRCRGKGKDGINWKLISQRLYNENKSSHKTYRCAKQCREHWNSYLNPCLKKGAWNRDEDQQLFKCIKDKNGGKKWAEIIKNFQGRTQNALKNRYTLLIEKLRKRNKHKTELELVREELQQCYLGRFTAPLQELQDSEDLQYFQQKDSQSVKTPTQHSLNLQELEEKIKFQTLPTVSELSGNWKKIEVKESSEFIKQLQSKNFKIDLKVIQFGVLNNGVFTKTPLDMKENGLSVFSKVTPTIARIF